MISTMAGLKAKVPDWLGRSDLSAETIDDVCYLGVSEIAADLDFYLTETVLTTKAIASQTQFPLPHNFAGATAFKAGNVRYERRSVEEVLDQKRACAYAVWGRLLVFYPAVDTGAQLELRYQGIERGTSDGAGVSVDALAEIFFRSEAETGVTEDRADLEGRFPVTADALAYPSLGNETFTDGAAASLDGLDLRYNAVDRLLARFPQAFQAMVLSHAYAYLQDSARELEWRQKATEVHIPKARKALMKSEYGPDKLTIRRTGGRYQ